MIFVLNDEDHHWLYFVYSVLEFWRSMVKVVLCFSDKRWNYKYHWRWWAWYSKTYYPANIRLKEDIFRLRLRKTSSSRLKDVLIKTNRFILRLQKASSRRLQDVLGKTNIFVLAICLQDVIKTPSRRLGQDQYIRLGHMSSRRLQDIFKTSSRRFQDVKSGETVCLGQGFA